MSANSQTFPTLPRGPDVLGELLHSLSQPLTSLRCSLELSLANDEKTDPRQETVSIALQQTERVIGMVQLMREYVEAEQPGPDANPSAMAPVARSVIEELCSIAAVHDIRLRLAGTCNCYSAIARVAAASRLAISNCVTAGSPTGWQQSYASPWGGSSGSGAASRGIQQFTCG